MSDKGTVSPKEKEATEKRGRGRPRKQPQVKTSDVSSIKSILSKFCHLYQVCIQGEHNRLCVRVYIIYLCVCREEVLRCKTRLTRPNHTSVQSKVEVTQVDMIAGNMHIHVISSCCPN